MNLPEKVREELARTLTSALQKRFGEHLYPNNPAYIACGVVDDVLPVVERLVAEARADERARGEDDDGVQAEIHDAELMDARDAGRAEGAAATRTRVESLIEASSLGTPEAKAARESVPREVGIAISRAAEYLARAEAAEAAEAKTAALTAAVRELVDEWERLAADNEAARAGKSTKVAAYYRRCAHQLRAVIDAADTTALDRHDAQVRAAHRREWAEFIDRWDGAVGPTPPTVRLIVEALRRDNPPFGVARADAQTSEGSDRD